jgi:hypothetical protein
MRPFILPLYVYTSIPEVIFSNPCSYHTAVPCEVTGFTLKPDGFFDGNPGIDIEPTVNKASELAGGC